MGRLFSIPNLPAKQNSAKSWWFTLSLQDWHVLYRTPPSVGHEVVSLPFVRIFEMRYHAYFLSVALSLSPSYNILLTFKIVFKTEFALLANKLQQHKLFNWKRYYSKIIKASLPSRNSASSPLKRPERLANSKTSPARINCCCECIGREVTNVTYSVMCSLKSIQVQRDTSKASSERPAATSTLQLRRNLWNRFNSPCPFEELT